MEIEFVRGIKMSEDTAAEVRRVASELGVILTAHAPYYVNLLSADQSKVEASIKRILDSARVGYLAGAWSVVFHPGYYGSLTPSEASERVRGYLKTIAKTLIDEGIEIWVRPETMGGLAEFGSLEEVITVSEGLENILPCIDFAHLYARSRGAVNNYKSFREVLELLETRLGSDAIKNMHIHISGMEYGERGEVKHLNLSDSLFNYIDALKAIKEFKVTGVLISESPNLEDDALVMLNTYRSL